MSASVTEKLCLQSIDDSRDRAISFLRQMIAIPSVTGDEAKIQKFLADYMGRSASMSTCGKRTGRS